MILPVYKIKMFKIFKLILGTSRTEKLSNEQLKLGFW